MDVQREVRSHQGGSARIRASDLPLAGSPPVALCFICGVEGPSYRPLGACMVLAEDGSTRGSLSSGCIDADIAHHAAEVARTGRARVLRYGSGSPFRDLVLPCGGAMDIRVIPAPGPELTQRLIDGLGLRQRLRLSLGDALLDQPDIAGTMGLVVDPDPRFVVFGKGPEALAFARMARGADYETLLCSPDPETLALFGQPDEVLHLGATSLQGIAIDAHTAGVVFFHDHDEEPRILAHLLDSPAFYVGAQGSRRAAAQRLSVLAGMGVAADRLARLRGPIGVIPSTRDPRTLAASVLAEILGEACRA